VGLLIKKLKEFATVPQVVRETFEAEIPEIFAMSNIPIEVASILGGGYVKEDQKEVFRLEQKITGVA
jgi:hypothetical protein